MTTAGKPMTIIRTWRMASGGQHVADDRDVEGVPRLRRLIERDLPRVGRLVEVALGPEDGAAVRCRFDADDAVRDRGREARRDERDDVAGLELSTGTSLA